MSAPSSPTPEAAPRRAPRSRKAASAPLEPGPPVQDGADWSSWPTYDSAAHGFRDYWYPTVWAHEVGEKPVPITLAGERIVLVRDGEVVRGLHDRCPHRGVPLSHGRREFPGTISCAYHGWAVGDDRVEPAGLQAEGPAVIGAADGAGEFAATV